MTEPVMDAMSHIWPIFKVRNTDQNAQPLKFCGTGFVVAGGFFITCWHCVSEPLNSDELYAAAYPAPNAPPGGAGLIILHDLAQDASGIDLAIAKVSAPVTNRLTVARRHAELSEEVYTLGFPLLPAPERLMNGNLVFRDVNRTFLRGYVTKTGEVELPDSRRMDAIEVDMLVPPGLSGAPLLRSGTLEVVGVLFGNHSSYTVETLSSVDPSTGISTPEVRSQVSFGLAHQTEYLWNARGPALGDSTLQQ